MSQAFLLTNTRLDELHYGALATMGADPLVKAPIGIRQYWKKAVLADQDAEQFERLVTWLTDNAQTNDFLVIEGSDELNEPVLREARRLGLIAMKPVWTPVPAFIPLIAEDH